MKRVLTIFTILGLTFAGQYALAQERPQISETARRQMGSNFDWNSVDPSVSYSLAKCVENFTCDPKAFVVAMGVGASEEQALEVSICVKAQTCDLNSYARGFDLTGGEHQSAMEIARKAKFTTSADVQSADAARD